MITRKELLENRECLFDKAFGSLVGLAIGDSFGDAARKADLVPHFGITTDFHKGASWSTDDTEFALLTAKTMIDCKGDLKSEHVVAAWLENVATQDEFKRGGFSEHEASINLRRGLRPPLSGKYNSYHLSNGAAMRIAPIGIYCAGDPEKAAKMAQVESEISHYSDGVFGAQAVAAAVSIAMVDGTFDEIFEAAVKAVPQDSWMHYTLQKAFEIVDSHNGDFFDSWMPLHDELWTSYWGTAPEAVAQAFGVLRLIRGGFKDTLIYACNFGRDADTIGAIDGGILGARYGASSIPKHWIEKARRTTGTCLTFTKGLDIETFARGLCDIIH